MIRIVSRRARNLLLSKALNKWKEFMARRQVYYGLMLPAVAFARANQTKRLFVAWREIACASSYCRFVLLDTYFSQWLSSTFADAVPHRRPATIAAKRAFFSVIRPGGVWENSIRSGCSEYASTRILGVGSTAYAQSIEMKQKKVHYEALLSDSCDDSVVSDDGQETDGGLDHEWWASIEDKQPIS
eukprot:Rmarinus@m.3486